MKKVITTEYEYDKSGQLIKETVTEENIITEPIPMFNTVTILDELTDFYGTTQ